MKTKLPKNLFGCHPDEPAPTLDFAELVGHGKDVPSDEKLDKEGDPKFVLPKNLFGCHPD